ncbi:hypothetical protein [Noviherbaspirillum pedocola]|uniref:Uncharacterized protein n=1 Tax=Noviherbaspirillum pedocola TaxID=2801341 RepID=A0A934WAB5_9BURK|nr:hypothetical protein [Noviherbaspirillum pedocola]MBK4738444.1 hypothetical protein [Noviherbaspirillum pedocola]
MKIEQIRSKLEHQELPDNFIYPTSFDAYLLAHPTAGNELEPWGITADPESNARCSAQYGLPLVKFAQAWHEDMIACFIAGTGDNPKVVVLNPWAQTLVDNEWRETGQVLEELPNFDAWLEWARNSELVALYAEDRTQRDG